MVNSLSEVQKRWVTVLIALMMCILLVALAESAIRLRQWMKFGTTSVTDDLLTYDIELGLKIPEPGDPKPGMHIDSHGFHNPELVLPKPEGRFRLAFVGGSTTFCAEVSSDEFAWPYLLWKSVSASYPDREIDFVNAGVPAFVVGESRTNLEKRVAATTPDVIVIYHATNDISSDAHKAALAQGLVEKDQFKPSWMGQYSLLWLLVEKNLIIQKRLREPDQSSQPLIWSAVDAAARFEKRLTELVLEAQSVASLVVLPTFRYHLRREHDARRQREAAASALYYLPYMTMDQLLTAYEEYNNAIRRVADDTGALLIDGELDIPGDGKHFHDTVHFTDLGSAFTATQISSALLADTRFKALLESD